MAKTYYSRPGFSLRLGDSILLLSELSENSADMILADPPYFLSSGSFSCHGGRRVSVKKGDWDISGTKYPLYPTGKNLDLKFIIKTSSNKEDLVLDAFCGSGTTLVVAEELGRNWIGIDSSEYAIKVTRKNLSQMPQYLFTYKPEYEFLKEQIIENKNVIQI